MNERDWREIQRAVRLSWFAYVFLPRPFLVIVSAMVGSTLIDDFFFSDRGFSAAWKHLVVSGFFPYGLGGLIFFNVLLRSYDRVAKRKLARLICSTCKADV